MYVYNYVYMYVCMYVCMYLSIYLSIYIIIAQTLYSRWSDDINKHCSSSHELKELLSLESKQDLLTSSLAEKFRCVIICGYVWGWMQGDSRPLLPSKETVNHSSLSSYMHKFIRIV